MRHGCGAGRRGKLGKEALDEIEPGAVLGREDEFEAADGPLGGCFVVLAFLLKKAFEFARRLKPVANVIPDQIALGATMEAAMAIGLILILCFLAGLFARTVLAQKIMSELESVVLS